MHYCLLKKVLGYGIITLKTFTKNELIVNWRSKNRLFQIKCLEFPKDLVGYRMKRYRYPLRVCKSSTTRGTSSTLLEWGISGVEGNRGISPLK